MMYMYFIIILCHLILHYLDPAGALQTLQKITKPDFLRSGFRVCNMGYKNQQNRKRQWNTHGFTAFITC